MRINEKRKKEKKKKPHTYQMPTIWKNQSEVTPDLPETMREVSGAKSNRVVKRA